MAQINENVEIKQETHIPNDIVNFFTNLIGQYGYTNTGIDLEEKTHRVYIQFSKIEKDPNRRMKWFTDIDTPSVNDLESIYEDLLGSNIQVKYDSLKMFLMGQIKNGMHFSIYRSSEMINGQHPQNPTQNIMIPKHTMTVILLLQESEY